MRRVNCSVRDGDLLNLTSRLLPFAIYFQDSFQEPFRAYPNGGAERIFFSVHLHIRTAPETSEAPFVGKIRLWLRIVNGSIAGVAAIRSGSVRVMKCVAGM